MAPPQISDLETIFGNLIKSMLSLGAVVLFVLLLSGGIKYLFSGGDPKNVDAAQKTITFAIGGLVLLLMSFLILTLIKTITGVDVTQFVIKQ